MRKYSNDSLWLLNRQPTANLFTGVMQSRKIEVNNFSVYLSISSCNFLLLFGCLLFINVTAYYTLDIGYRLGYRLFKLML